MDHSGSVQCRAVSPGNYHALYLSAVRLVGKNVIYMLNAADGAYGWWYQWQAAVAEFGVHLLQTQPLLPSADTTTTLNNCLLVKVLRPTRHKIDHFGDVPQANRLAWYGKKTKPNTTKAHIQQSK